MRSKQNFKQMCPEDQMLLFQKLGLWWNQQKQVFLTNTLVWRLYLEKHHLSKRTGGKISRSGECVMRGAEFKTHTVYLRPYGSKNKHKHWDYETWIYSSADQWRNRSYRSMLRWLQQGFDLHLSAVWMGRRVCQKFRIFSQREVPLNPPVCVRYS